MKLEKREITLNEKDSLFDVFCLQKLLLFKYVEILAQVERKETKKTILDLMRETGEEMCFLKDLIDG